MSFATTGNASLFLPLPDGDDDPYDGICVEQPSPFERRAHRGGTPTSEARAADTAGPLTQRSNPS